MLWKQGLRKEDLLKILRKRRIPYSKAKKLIEGENIPYTAWKERMKKKSRGC